MSELIFSNIFAFIIYILTVIPFIWTVILKIKCNLNKNLEKYSKITLYVLFILYTLEFIICHYLQKQEGIKNWWGVWSWQVSLWLGEWVGCKAT